MQIKKIFNNNVLLADRDGCEVVLIGKGIGFQKKQGELVDDRNVDKLYMPTEKRWMSLFDDLINDISPIYFEVASRIIKMAEKDLNTKFNAYLLIVLADHIHFAIQRVQRKIIIRNELLWEIQHFYKIEYRLGEQSLDLIYKQFFIRLPDDEAGFIALKFVENRISQAKSGKGLEMTRLIGDILTIVQYQLQIKLKEDSISYQRFLVHLRFFVERITSNKKEDNQKEKVDDVLYQHIFRKYPQAFNCTQRIQEFLKRSLKKKISINEQVYLTIHIQRIINEFYQ
ncbi:Transcriptional antiterminator [Oenococcus oeni]|uniref:PRD domain-containing protein n=1 Tax=Oenococcus oeni TaxID=1247 RepID=UPI001079A26A|nr:PRD domain-containing protein [Oenococcus oeni]AVI94224.1 transcriptional antiterminator [Oenococcus oeni]SYW00132.1 Transcriptional antiterminator [Oenococcus oeni]SYW04366.1 Transcriptional antiterminator [Oenococcus oeni]SYW17507.1 Transcriptional antiterminator [Oenococcus oeni]VDC14769.1 Transcriptional antiterminator [Oenococcus oeni]